MKKSLKVLLILVVLGFSTFSAVLGTKVLSEERITTDTSDQVHPAIYGDIVVWQDNRNQATTGLDIYGYNLKTKEELPICTFTANQDYPAIYGDIVVWQDNRNGNYDIYGYNLTTGESFQIYNKHRMTQDQSSHIRRHRRLARQ